MRTKTGPNAVGIFPRAFLSAANALSVEKTPTAIALMFNIFFNAHSHMGSRQFWFLHVTSAKPSSQDFGQFLIHASGSLCIITLK